MLLLSPPGRAVGGQAAAHTAHIPVVGRAACNNMQTCVQRFGGEGVGNVSAGGVVVRTQLTHTPGFTQPVCECKRGKLLRSWSCEQASHTAYLNACTPTHVHDPTYTSMCAHPYSTPPPTNNIPAHTRWG